MRIGLIVAVALLFSTRSFASLQDTVHFRESGEAMKPKLAEFNEKCGFSLAFEFDQKSFAGWDWEKHTAAHACQDGVGLLANTCEGSPEGKAAIKANIKKMVCAQRPKDTPEKYSISGGTYLYTVVNEGYNSHGYDWLKNNMKTAGGSTIENTRDWASRDESLKDDMKDLNSLCETNIKWIADRKSFAGRNEDWAGPSWCSTAITLIRDECKENESFRKKTVKKIKTIICKGGTIEDTTYQKLSGGNLFFIVGKSQGMDVGKVREAMRKALQ